MYRLVALERCIYTMNYVLNVLENYLPSYNQVAEWSQGCDINPL